MLNEFRTLLLNISYAGDGTEHIPSGFTALPLSSPFKDIYNILFPPGSSRYYKQFVANCYLSIMNAAGLEKDIIALDPRISYTIEDANYFKIYRHSNPAISDLTYPIFVYGDYTGIQTSGTYYDNFLITQVGDSANILVYSTVNNTYFNGNTQYPSPTTDAQITLDLSSNINSSRKISLIFLS